MATPLRYRPVPIGVGSLVNNAPSGPLLGAPVVPPLGAPVVAPLGAPVAPTLGAPVAPTVPAPAAPVVSMGSSSVEMPVEGAQPEEMRFTQAEYNQFMNSLGQANLAEQEDYIQIGDFFRRDPESDSENPSYLYTGSPINFYGGYGVDKDGNRVKITSGNAVFTGGIREGQPIPRDFVVNSFMRELAGIDESGGGADPQSPGEMGVEASPESVGPGGAVGGGHGVGAGGVGRGGPTGSIGGFGGDDTGSPGTDQDAPEADPGDH